MSNEVLKYSSFTLLFLLSLISFVVELSFIRILDAHYSITFSYIAITCALFGFSVAGFDIKEQNKKQMIFSVIVNLFLIAMSIQIANMFLIRNSIQWNKSLLNSIKSIGDIIFLLIALSSPFYFFGRINFLITKYYTKEISKIYF